MICKHFVIIEVSIRSHIFIKALRRWKKLHVCTSKFFSHFSVWKIRNL